MSAAAVPWSEVAARLRPFVARRVPAGEIDDVVQDVLVRMHRGITSVRDDDRFAAWVFQIARNSIADHHRTRARHPMLAHPEDAATELDVESAEVEDDDDRAAANALVGCIAIFVARLDSPYREAITLVELDGMTMREAAETVGVSTSGMKSRVQRGRAQLRQMFEACCEIAVDARGKPTDFTPRPAPRCGCE